MSKWSAEFVHDGVHLKIMGSLLDDVEWSVIASVISEANDDEPNRELTVSTNSTIWGEPATPEFIEFAKAIGANKSLNKITYISTSKYLDNNQDGVFLKELSNNRLIKRLCLQIDHFDLNVNRALSKILSNNQKLTRLDIRAMNNYDMITQDISLELVRSLKMTVLERLKISIIDDKGFENLLQYLPSRLIYLDVSVNNITKASLPQLQSFIKSNRTLKQLICDNNLVTTYFEQYNNVDASKMSVKIIEASSFEATLASKEFVLNMETEELTGNQWKMFVDELTKNDSTWGCLNVTIHNRISSTYFKQLLIVIAREHGKLIRIKIKYDKLDKEKQIELFHALYKNNTITDLCLECKFNADIFILLLKILNDKSTITKLHLNGNTYMGDNEAIKLAQCLKQKKAFTDLELTETCIGDKGFQALLNSLLDPIEKVCILNSLVTAKSLPTVLTFIEGHSNLNAFTLLKTGISMESKEIDVADILEEISNIAREKSCECMIDTNENVKEKLSEIGNEGNIEMSFFENNLHDDHILELYNGLKTVPTIRNRHWTFSFGLNPRISPTGYQYLANILPTLSITDLSFEFCEMNDEKVKVLFTGLVKNKTLKRLNLSSNEIGSQGTEHIARYLQNNTTLIDLDLHENQINDDGAVHLASVLSKTRLQELSLNTNSIGDRGCGSILSSLPSSLVKLSLHNNRITKSSLDKIVQFLSGNRTLKDLYMDPNPIFGNNAFTDGHDTVKCWMQAKKALEINKICKLH